MPGNDLDSCLKRKGLKTSPIKRAILEVIEESEQPLNAEAILSRVRQLPVRKPSINTIYRALQTLYDCRLISAIQFGSVRFFFRKEEACCVCKACGQIDYIDGLAEKLQQEISTVFELEGTYEFVIYGFCKACAKSEHESG